MRPPHSRASAPCATSPGACAQSRLPSRSMKSVCDADESIVDGQRFVVVYSGQQQGQREGEVLRSDNVGWMNQCADGKLATLGAGRWGGKKLSGGARRSADYLGSHLACPRRSPPQTLNLHRRRRLSSTNVKHSVRYCTHDTLPLVALVECPRSAAGARAALCVEPWSQTDILC